MPVINCLRHLPPVAALIVLCGVLCACGSRPDATTAYSEPAHGHWSGSLVAQKAYASNGKVFRIVALQMHYIIKPQHPRDWATLGSRIVPLVQPNGHLISAQAMGSLIGHPVQIQGMLQFSPVKPPNGTGWAKLYERFTLAEVRFMQLNHNAFIAAPSYAVLRPAAPPTLK
ncbi:MAG: hypothetical protein HKL96_14095 [Phycisphaerales bacterium]|nr:hypothetical protein [Phycisphaerales bacterium]